MKWMFIFLPVFAFALTYPDANNVEYWKQTLQSSEFLVLRKMAAHQISKISFPESLEVLKKSFALETNSQVREAIVQAIERLGDVSTLDFLKEVSEEDKDRSVRNRAFQAHEKLSQKQVQINMLKEKLDKGELKF